MPAISGRKINLYRGSGVEAVLVGAGREHGVTFNGEPIDITAKGSNGWRELMADVGVRSVDISFSGLLDDDAMIATVVGPTSALLEDYEVRIEGLGILAGSWALNGVELGSPHDDSAEQSGTLLSNGVITWTAT